MGDAWEALTQAAPLEQAGATAFLTADQAPSCPAVELTRMDGQKASLRPGMPGYAEQGNVTMIVFWPANLAAGRAAARHVGDLVSRYNLWRVRAVGIVEKPQSLRAVEEFANLHNLRFPIYLDDMSALKAMASEAGAADKTALPYIFIVDRQMRLRFYRAGFSFSAGYFDRRDPGTETIFENAPKGQTVKDYLERILDER
jgi:peroxiredoxin